jgi:hypothetical protein
MLRQAAGANRHANLERASDRDHENTYIVAMTRVLSESPLPALAAGKMTHGHRFRPTGIGEGP